MCKQRTADRFNGRWCATPPRTFTAFPRVPAHGMKQLPQAADPGPASPLRRDLGVFLLMLLAALLAYSPVAFMQHPLKWDMLDCYLPWRTFAAGCFAHGTFPLWDPYQSFGYPIYGDLRSVFYPDALLAGLFAGGYGIYLLHGLFIGYLALAGTGMYLLAGHFTRRVDVRVLVGLAYLLSGFFTGHAQEMFTFTAATWIPWVIYHAIHVLRGEGRGGHPPKLALVLFLQLTGGYQAMSIVLLYLLAALGLAITVQRLRAGDGRAVRQLLARMALWSLLVAASLAVLWVSFLDIGPHVSRFSGVSPDMSRVSPFPPKALLSLILPYAVIAQVHTFGTDLSATNLYVGLLPLAAFLAGLFRRRNTLEYVVLAFGLMCLLASFGAHTPVQPWLFRHAPLMNLFRMPALLRYFTVVAFLLLAAGELDRWLTDPARSRRRALISIAGVLAALIGAEIWAMRQSGAFRFPGEWRLFLAGQDDASIAGHVLMQAPLQAVFLLLAMLAALGMRRHPRRARTVFFALLLVEMGTAIRLNMDATVVSGEIPVSRIADVVRSGPDEPLVPDLRRTIGMDRNDDPALWPLWRNTGNFTKLVSPIGFNSFQINSSWDFETHARDLFDATLRQPVAFLSYRLCPEDRWRAGGRAPEELVVPDQVYGEWAGQAYHPSPADRVELDRFDPGSARCSVHTENGAVLTLAQMDHPGWAVRVDGEAVKHAPGQLALLSLPVPPGSHVVEFTFSKPWVVRAYWFSYLMVALFIGMILFHRFRARPGSSFASAFGRAAAWAVLLCIAIATAWACRPSWEQRRQSDLVALGKAVGSARAGGTGHAFLDVDLPAELEKDLRGTPGTREYFRSPWGLDLTRVDGHLRELRREGTPSVLLAGRGGRLSPATEEMFRHHYPQRRVVAEQRGLYAYLFSKGTAREPLFSIRREAGRAADHWPLDAFERNGDTSHVQVGAWRLDPGYPGPPGFDAAVGDLRAGTAVRIVFSLDATRVTPRSIATLWLVVRRPGGGEWSRSLRLDDDGLQPGRSARVFLVNTPPVPLRADDRIIAFVWNDGTGPVIIRDMRIEAFPR